MTRTRNMSDLLDSSGDVKSSALDNTSSDLVDDSTPQLGGDLSTNGNDINFGERIRFSLRLDKLDPFALAQQFIL